MGILKNLEMNIIMFQLCYCRYLRINFIANDSFAENRS